MQLPGRSSDDVVVVSSEGAPARRHEPTCAGNLSSKTMEMRGSTTLDATRLLDCCTTVPRVAPSLGVTVGKRVIEPLSLVGKKCKFPLVHAVVGLVAASCVRAAYDKHSHSDLQHQP